MCTSLIPSDAARLRDAECAELAPTNASASSSAAALFYNHRRVDDSGCRLANVPMERGSFNFHYNEQNAAFSNGDGDGARVMTLTMHGSSGVRLTTKDGRHRYGAYQVSAKADASSGAVSAWYLRSSDDYNPQNHGAFDEIDFEVRAKLSLSELRERVRCVEFCVVVSFVSAFAAPTSPAPPLRP